MLECINGSYYTGYTTDVTRRYQEHQAGSAKCKYTRAFPPERIARVWEFENKSDALRAEAKIKKLSKREKILCVRQKSSTHEDVR